jgi:hypothetical protein
LGTEKVLNPNIKGDQLINADFFDRYPGRALIPLAYHKKKYHYLKIRI